MSIFAQSSPVLKFACISIASTYGCKRLGGWILEREGSGGMCYSPKLHRFFRLTCLTFGPPVARNGEEKVRYKNGLQTRDTAVRTCQFCSQRHEGTVVVVVVVVEWLATKSKHGDAIDQNELLSSKVVADAVSVVVWISIGLPLWAIVSCRQTWIHDH